jgi:hypothetical protein
MNQETVKDDITTIQVKKSVRERLGRLGRMDETYSDFIVRLLDVYEKQLANDKVWSDIKVQSNKDELEKVWSDIKVQSNKDELEKFMTLFANLYFETKKEKREEEIKKKIE